MPARINKPPHFLHRHLHLQHRSHTGHVLHHRHTSYRSLALVLGLAGAFIAGLNILASVTADSLYVYARNPAPIPTSAAVITDPTDNAVLHSSPVTVSGTCPVITPRVIVVILVDGQETSSVACDASYTFSVPVDLSYGDHTLIARIYTITNDRGPDSTPVHVHYPAPPAPPTPSSPRLPSTLTAPRGTPTNTPGGSSNGQRLVIISRQPFIVYGPSKDAVWIGHISGGTPPYHLHINWGDNKSDNYSVDGSEQYFHHHYRIAQAYIEILSATDKVGARATSYIAAVTPYRAPVIAGPLSTPGSPWGGSTMLGIYGLYLLLLAFFGYLWVRRHKFAYAKVAQNSSRTAATQRRRQGRR